MRSCLRRRCFLVNACPTIGRRCLLVRLETDGFVGPILPHWPPGCGQGLTALLPTVGNADASSPAEKASYVVLCAQRLIVWLQRLAVWEASPFE